MLVIHHFEETMPHTREHVFALIVDVETYPSFVPFCRGLHVQKRSMLMPHVEQMEALMTVHFKNFEQSFESLVDIDRKHMQVTIHLLRENNSYIKKLCAKWSLETLYDDDCSTYVCLDIDVEAKNLAHKMLLNFFMGHFAGQLIAAFKKQAYKTSCKQYIES